MGLAHLFQSEKEDLFPEETKIMKDFINNLKIQDYYFSNENSNDRIYELLKKFMKKELINFFELNKTKAVEEFNNKIKEQNSDYDFNEFVCQIINIEGGKEICMNKIYDEINEINKNKKQFEINYFTVMLIGKSGVGKSTLINNLLQLTGERMAKTGVGNYITSEIKEYKSDAVPFLRLVDTRGIEINKEHGVNEIQEEAEKYIKKQYNTNNINNFVQCIWYCITGNRLEDAEIELIRNLRKTYINNKIPIIIVYTQASDDEMMEEMNNYIKNKKIDVNFINILAQRKKFHGQYVEAFGLKELIKETLQRCKKALKGDNDNEIGTEMGTIITKKIGEYILAKISRNNRLNTENSYKNIVSQFIVNYNNLKSEDEFLYFIIYLFGIGINSFLNVKKIKEKSFNSLKSLTIIQNNSFEYIQYYNKYVNSVIEPVLKSFSVDFLDYQVEIQKQKNKEIKLMNKKTIKEFSETTSNFLNQNFYYLAQVYYIYNIIPQYYPNLAKCFERTINNLTRILLNNSRIKERINECFVNKFKQFQKRVYKFYNNEITNGISIDFQNNNCIIDNDFNYLSVKDEDEDARNKINMTIVKNNLSLSRKNIQRNNIANESSTYKDENNNTNNSFNNSLPSYDEFLKGNIKNNNSAPTAKYNK